MNDITKQTTKELEARLSELANESAAIRAEIQSRVGPSRLSMETINKEVMETFQAGGLASAMRHYRSQTGCGLKEAHDAVQSLIRGESL